MGPRVVRSREELLAVLRDRRDELDLAHAPLEQLLGWSSGYLSKVIAAKPIKGLSAQGFRDILDGLALGIVAIVIDEDPEQAERMKPRWTRRKRPPTTNHRSRCVAKDIKECQSSFEFTSYKNINKRTELVPPGDDEWLSAT
jgi:hypothetical protein